MIEAPLEVRLRAGKHLARLVVKVLAPSAPNL